ncbi:hypothetical protein OC846_001838 [Tilletia horrida]|uniref:Cutinase n=1 Tax=Tilletia horrida TaxID=155126 RepID=A0AAN6GT15_9BASI|nr:hypothetical protein OC845_001572 [Tilletia horrida]KAK0555157.1 hypothetical protein OC846_001838 [Tilletia horrida]KAK0568427.1 hypothetical protein OC861_001984 [Tilletia horrida]
MFGLNFAVATLALLGASASNASPFERRACTKYEIITARGTGQAQGQTFGYTAMLTKVLKSVPGGSHYDLVYPASLDLENSATAGVKNLTAHLKAGVKSCPTRNYALIGYSQGAEVMNRVLEYINSGNNATVFNRIKAVVYIGNPSHKPYSAANFDEKGGNSTNPYTGVFNYFDEPSPRLLPFIKAKKLHDICFNYDTICAADQVAPSGQDSTHGMYNDSASVQSQGAKFIQAKLTA